MTLTQTSVLFPQDSYLSANPHPNLLLHTTSRQILPYISSLLLTQKAWPSSTHSQTLPLLPFRPQFPFSFLFCSLRSTSCSLVFVLPLMHWSNFIFQKPPLQLGKGMEHFESTKIDSVPIHTSYTLPRSNFCSSEYAITRKEGLCHRICLEHNNLHSINCKDSSRPSLSQANIVCNISDLTSHQINHRLSSDLKFHKGISTSQVRVTIFKQKKIHASLLSFPPHTHRFVLVNHWTLGWSFGKKINK